MNTASGAAEDPRGVCSANTVAGAERRFRLAPLDIIILVVVAGLLFYWFIPAFYYYYAQWGMDVLLPLRWLITKSAAMIGRIFHASWDLGPGFMWGRAGRAFMFVRDSYYIHGPLVPLISFMLAWQRKKELKDWAPQTSLAGLWLVAIGVLMRFFGDRTDMRFVSGFAFVFVLAGLIWYIGGVRLIRFLAFPVFFLFFMCPLPSSVYIPFSVPLQVVSTVVAAQMTNLVGIQASRMGAEILTTQGEPLMVGQPCSGFRLLVTLLAAAFIFSYLMEAPLWRKGVLLAMVVPLALVMNSLRVFLLVVDNHFLGAESMHSVHDASGYAIVIVACLVFMWLMRLIGCREYKQVE